MQCIYTAGYFTEAIQVKLLAPGLAASPPGGKRTLAGFKLSREDGGGMRASRRSRMSLSDESLCGFLVQRHIWTGSGMHLPLTDAVPTRWGLCCLLRVLRAGSILEEQPCLAYLAKR